MSLTPVKFLVSPSVSIANGSTTVTVTGGVDARHVYDGTVVFIGDNAPVEAIGGVIPNAQDISTIKLRLPWVKPNVTNEPLIAFNTSEGLSEAIRRARSIGDLLEAALLSTTVPFKTVNYDDVPSLPDPTLHKGSIITYTSIPAYSNGVNWKYTSNNAVIV